MPTLLQDLRQTFRQLRRQPVFTACAILTLAIGMGVNAVAFSVLNGLLFKGSATSAAAGVGRIAVSPQDDEDRNASLPEFRRFAEALQGAAAVAAEGRTTVAWKHGGATETAWALFVSEHYFTMVRPQVRAGQLRLQRRGADAPVVMIGERFWREKLGSSSLAGLTLRLNNVDVSVAGVMAEAYTSPAGIYSPDVWLPLDDLGTFSTAAALQHRGQRWLFVMARPHDGVAPAVVQGHLDTSVAAMQREWPDTHKGHPVQFRRIGEAGGERQGVMAGAAIGMAIIGLVLLLACFNVANLLLARAVERERDMGIRTALGARPARLMRYVITEGFVLASIAGVLALLLARWTQTLMATFAIPIEQPQHIDLEPDANVTLFITALIVVAGVLPGLWPAWTAARINVVNVLGSPGAAGSSARPSRVRRWLAAAQVAGSTMFLTIAGLFVQSYAGIQDAHTGFARDRLVLAEVDPGQYGQSAEAAARYVTALAQAVRALPGVEAVAIADRAPFFIGYDRMTRVWPASGGCEPDTCVEVPTYAIEPGYFSTMAIALKEGREFSLAGAGEVIVTDRFATEHWPGGSALGRTIRIGAHGTPATIVGVTADTRTRGLDRERPALFVPIAPQHYENQVTLVARTAGDPISLVRPVAEAAAAVDADVPPLSVKTMEQRMAVQMWPFRTLSMLFSICGALALSLATAGLAAIVVHSVNRRFREFGVRLSIGATPRDLIGEVLRSSARLLVPGLIAGLVLAAIAARFANAMFVGVNVLNPLTYVLVAALQAGIVTAACIYPALKASRVDAMSALRAD